VLVDVTAETQQKGLPGRLELPVSKISWQFLAAKAVWARVQLPSMLPLPSAQSGAKVGLLDADIYGPNAPTMLGLDSTDYGAAR